MNSKIYVGNLPYQIENATLENLFSSYGNVKTVNIIKDRDTGRAKGFGFVEMETAAEANQAIEGLNNQELEGRPLRVNIANDDNRKPFTNNRF